MTYIEVQRWGDFNQKYTECIMFSEDKIDIKIVLREFSQTCGLPNGTEGFTYKQLASATDDLIAYLELRGFKKLMTDKIIFSD